MAEITVLARGEDALVYARMLARALTAGGQIAAAREKPTGREAICVADLDSVPAEICAALLPETTYLYTATDAVAVPDSMRARLLVRPFSVAALQARLPKPALGEGAPMPAIEKLTFLPDGDAAFAEEPLGLSPTEASLLRYLYARRGTACTRGELYTAVFGGETANSNIVDVYIRYIRTKLDEKYNVKLLYAVRGQGYMLK